MVKLSNLDDIVSLSQRLKHLRKIRSALINPPEGTKVVVMVIDPQGNSSLKMEFPIEDASTTINTRIQSILESLNTLGVDVNA